MKRLFPSMCLINSHSHCFSIFFPFPWLSAVGAPTLPSTAHPVPPALPDSFPLPDLILRWSLCPFLSPFHLWSCFFISSWCSHSPLFLLLPYFSAVSPSPCLSTPGWDGKRVLEPPGPLRPPSSSLLSLCPSRILLRLPLSRAAPSPACKGSKSAWLGEEMRSGLPGRHHLASQPRPHLQPELSICQHRSQLPPLFLFCALSLFGGKTRGFGAWGGSY